MDWKKTTGILALIAIIVLAGSVATEARLAPPGVQHDRQAVVNEAYYAVAGIPYSYPPSNVGQWNYLLSDVGAYWRTRDNWTVRYPPDSCMTDNNDDRLRDLFLAGNLPAYGFAGGVGRGGQCKYFANLLLYRAGVANVDPMPTYLGLQEQSRSSGYAKPGDVLFRQNYHTAIVTQILRGDPNEGTVTGVQVVDSNWVNGKGNEIIGMHNYYDSELSIYSIWTGAPYYHGTIPNKELSADLNCDNKVNLADYAILMSFWEKDPSGANSCQSPDINQDGKVNLADFSIMMSLWTG